MHWHRQSYADVLQHLEVDPQHGLTEEEAASRQARHGANELPRAAGRGAGRILWEQLRGALVIVLIIAAGVSAVLHEYTDAIVILAIVVLNAILGFVQDYRAEKALAALQKMAQPRARVRRSGSVREVSASQLVPGDLILLDAEQTIPADCRLLESVGLRVDEAALTGESEPVVKQTEALPEGDLPLGDRTNMAFMATVATRGHGRAVVTATGTRTEVGQIATDLHAVEMEPTPLQQRLARLGRTLAVIALGIVTLVFALGVLRGEDPRLMLMTALSMAVAVVPEGLPAVATAALALAARRMFRRQALIRRLPAVETLGSVTVICSDKTGTLTENQMQVAVLEVAGRQFEVPQATDACQGRCDDEEEDPVAELSERAARDPALALLLSGAGLCNDAEVERTADGHGFQAAGDPTEGALAVVAARLGFPKDRLQRIFPRIAEAPFNSDRARMTTVHRIAAAADAGDRKLGSGGLKAVIELDGDCLSFTKGAVDRILHGCGYVWIEDQPEPLDEAGKRRISEAHEQIAGRGMRVLGVAFRPCDGWTSKAADRLAESNSPASATGNATAEALDPTDDRQLVEELEQDLIFIGMLGMMDPPRAEAAEAVSRCKSAGIRPVMITGDHPLTAVSIAKSLEIDGDGSVLTGADLQQLDGDQLRSATDSCSVYARVAPRDKLKLVQALQENGHFVAMTGDGINDAPALKQAHIGIAMGITGTDVAKEASQMVLLDDNFATIVGAVEEGRVVYDNIRKFVKYTMTSNAGEVWVMVLGPLMGMPLPLLPLQILWINLVTDGLPGLALVAEGAERNTMRRAPHPPGQRILDRRMVLDIAWIGLLMGAISLALGYWYWGHAEAEQQKWRTLIFTVLTFAQMGNVMAIRSASESLFRIGVFSNRALAGSVLLTFMLQLAVIFWPPLQNIFQTTALTAGELVLCLLVSSVVFWAVELQKWLRRRRRA